MNRTVYYSETGRIKDKQVWAGVIETKAEIERIAKDLLKSLLPQFPKAKVWIENIRIKL